MANNGIRNFDWSSIGRIFKTNNSTNKNSAKELQILYNGDEKLWPAGKTIYSLEITTPPDKTIYTLGENIDITGAVLTVTYTNTSQDIIYLPNQYVTYTPAAADQLGYQYIVFTYAVDEQEIRTDDYANNGRIWCSGIKVERNTLSSYYIGDTFNPSYYNITYYGDDTNITDISEDENVIFKIENTQIDSSTIFSSAGEKVITIEYGDYTATISETVLDYSLQSIIIINSEQLRTLYKTGDTLDLSYLRIKALYNHHQDEIVWDNGPINNNDNQFIFSMAHGSSIETPGIQEIKIYYTEGGISTSTSFNIIVKGISVKRSRKTNYFVGYTFDTSNYDIAFYDETGNFTIIDTNDPNLIFTPANGYTFLNTDISNHFIVNISYEDENNITYYTTLSLYIQDVLLDSIIQLITYPQVWDKDVAFDVSEFYIKVRYNDGTTKTIQCSSSNTTISPSSISTLGSSSASRRIVLSYTEKDRTKSKTFSCWIMGIEVDTTYTQQTYYIGQTFDITKCKINFYNNEKSVEEITSQCTFSIDENYLDENGKFNQTTTSLAIGVSYDHYTTSFNVQIQAVAPATLVVTHNAKEIYEIYNYD